MKISRLLFSVIGLPAGKPWKAILVPSGDHEGTASCPRLVVRRVAGAVDSPVVALIL